MAGDPSKASLWADADVYLAEELTTPNPATVAAAFSSEWGLVGLLDGEAGFEEGRAEDKSDHYAWGGILIRTSRKNFKMTKKFIALEDNPHVRGLVYPGSTGTEIVVPRHGPRKIAFEVRDGERIERLITRRFAVVDTIGTIKDGEDELKKFEVTVSIFPDGGGVLFDRQSTDDEEPETP
ncbi:hypothetical protein [Micromonospora craniellae]|uniref:Phage tail protein n=1 Tax=Micromonospora craniellae TaxID=2294034 RepID=A0A372G2N8_9ACTN|nr:hypothetical protein [Micromonospora craniellae]QOC89881.1 hypothetical protein ID554_16725 [Micromonospora craniellae]RFS47026.1 hypothetical protein D0Q02_07640 [Micromonospora craniellae]